MARPLDPEVKDVPDQPFDRFCYTNFLDLNLIIKHNYSALEESRFIPREFRGQGKNALTNDLTALNKWLKKDFDVLTAHCLRHTFRDRVRAVECPMDMIDQDRWVEVC